MTHEGHAHAESDAGTRTSDPDDKERIVPNRPEKRALARKLKRPIVGRTGRPWPMKRKTGQPAWKHEALLRRLKDMGINVTDRVPEALRGEAA